MAFLAASDEAVNFFVQDSNAAPIRSAKVVSFVPMTCPFDV